MADPTTPGRMLRKNISRNASFAKLSPKAMVLFFFIIPHLNAFGKSNGDPSYIKTVMVPLVSWLKPTRIRKLLFEIDQYTNLKWFKSEEDGLYYLHNITWEKHQKLRSDRLGTDLDPSHPLVRDLKKPLVPDLVPHEVKVKVKTKDKTKVKDEVQDEPCVGGNGLGVHPPSATSQPNSDNLTLLKRDALTHAVRECQEGRMTTEQAYKHLQTSGFTPRELVVHGTQFATKDCNPGENAE